MTMKRWDGAAYQDLATAKRWDGAAYQDLTVAKRWDGVAWIDITLPGGGGGDLSATANKENVFNNELDFEPAPAFKTLTTTQSVLVTATGGIGAGPTYAWTKLSGDSAILCNSPTAASTYFNCTIGKNQFKEAIWRCTVTRGVQTATVDVHVSFDYSTGL